MTNINKPTTSVIDFLRESNAIEGVYDDDSLQQAQYAWEYLISQEKITPSVVLKTHKILMLHQPLRPDEKGYFRMAQVWIGGKEGLHYSEIREAMKGWCERANLQVAHPGSRIEEDIQAHHVLYENIHPFIDGNGGTGRMFMNWQRLKLGLPILVIKADEKLEYYKWFNEEQ
jgi:Fic family protein